MTRLRLGVSSGARLHERSARYAAVTLRAAAADDAAAELWRWGRHEQEKDIRAVLSLVVKRVWLSQSQADDAVDAALVLTSHETYAQFCLERGWAQDRYTGWLIAHLTLEIRPELTTAAGSARHGAQGRRGADCGISL